MKIKMKKFNWDIIFNRFNLTKVFIIFIVGFISRILVNQFLGVNVFIDYTNTISLIYYLVMSSFVVIVHELVGYLNFSIIPSCIITLFNDIPKVNFNALKLSSLRNAACFWSMKDNNVNKVTLQLDNKINNHKEFSSCDNIKHSSNHALYRNNDSSGKQKNIGTNKTGSSNNQGGNSRGNSQDNRAHNLRHYNRNSNIRDL